MKIKRIHINHFGKLNNETLSFGDGIHVISGENESGKSTLHAFFRSMLFGIERGRGRAARTDAYSRYQPWEGGSYGGVLELERDQSTYSIYRTFEKSSPVCRLADETRSRELEPSAENFSELLCGLTPALFGNTISVSQLKAETNADLADSLRNHIVNLHTTGSATLNVNRAIDSLRADKKKLEAGIVRDADQETEVLTEQLASLEQVLKDSSAEQEIARLEKKKGILEETIQFLGTRQQRMAHQQKRGENALTHYHFSHPAEADEVYAQTEELEAQADQYLSRYHRPLGLILRFALLLFSLLLAILLLFCGYHGIQRISSAQYPIAALFFGGSLLSGVGIFFAMRRFFAAASYHALMRELKGIWEDHFDEPPKRMTRKRLEDLKKKLNSCRNLFATMQDSQDSIANDMKKLMAAQTELNTLNQELEKAQHVSWQAEQMGERRRALEEQIEVLRGTVEENKAKKEDQAAIQLAIDTLQHLSTHVFDSFGYFLEETTSQILSGITGGAYTGVSIDTDLSISLDQNGRRVLLHQVSSGTMDQVYLALRLACIEFLWPDEAMPLFLDDTFALYDKDRLAATLRWLSENYTGQIFIFSCHTREEELLKELNIPHQSIQL